MDKKTINNEIVDALVRWMPVTVAKEVVRGLAKGIVPHVAVRYDG